MSASKAGRTVAEILADPSTPKEVATMLSAALQEWEYLDNQKRKLGEWAMEGRAINNEGRDV
jgi:hypothetical protein